VQAAVDYLIAGACQPDAGSGGVAQSFVGWVELFARPKHFSAGLVGLRIAAKTGVNP